MEDILRKISAHAHTRVAVYKQSVSPEEMEARARSMPANTGFPFERALAAEGVSFICEVKRASPSKGLIAKDFPYLEIAREYEKAGASAISVLTEPEWFLGKDEYLSEIASAVDIPCIRKDFVVDEYMIYQAKVLGASAVLFICSILDEDTLSRYLGIAHGLGLSALVEAHDSAEVGMAVRAGARIIGVNNRNLRSFDVDISNSSKLAEDVPDGILFVAESGIKNAEDVRRMKESGADAVLVGETLMRAEDKKAKLSELKGTS